MHHRFLRYRDITQTAVKVKPPSAPNPNPEDDYPGATAQLFSSLKRTGREEAQACIEAWVETHKQKAPAKGD